MDLQTQSGSEVVIGNCQMCDEKGILVRYDGDSYCTRCIQQDEHLSVVIGWRT